MRRVLVSWELFRIVECNQVRQKLPVILGYFQESSSSSARRRKSQCVLSNLIIIKEYQAWSTGDKGMKYLLNLRLNLLENQIEVQTLFNFNKLNYKMQRFVESSSAHAQIVQKFMLVFPNMNVPQINPNNSILDALNDIIKKIPRPHVHETHQTISSMKNYVDGQELRIQMNMMELEEVEPVALQTFMKKCSMETREGEQSWDDRSVGAEEWGWDSKGLAYHESLEHEFSSYLD